MKKNVWEKPMLVILYKGHPEESVLTYCKSGVTGLPVGQVNARNGYDCLNPARPTCGLCSATSNVPT
jgi:hypothetical protein